MTKEIVIPFAGFYETQFEAMLSSSVDRDCDECTDSAVVDRVQDAILDCQSYGKARVEFSHHPRLG